MRRRLFAAVWEKGQGIKVDGERAAWSAEPGHVRVRYDDGALTSVTGFHRSAHLAEHLVMSHVRDLLMGPTQA